MVSPDAAERVGLGSGSVGGDGGRGGAVGGGTGFLGGRSTRARLRGPPAAWEMGRLATALRPPPMSEGVGAPEPMLGAADGC